MRIGQTSFVVFASKLLGSALGFVATIYFARELGAEVLGYYAIVVALVAWLRLGGNMGVAAAMTKRMSEGEEPSRYAAASAVLMAALGLIVAVLVLAFRESIDAYVGQPVAPLVALILLVTLFEGFANSALRGERKVHVAGLLSPVGVGFRSLLQIGFIAVGFGLTAMLVGFALGSVLVGVVGVLALSIGLARPRRRHFEELLDYAKFSWLGGLKSRSFNDVDVLLLGVFVQSSLVGVYSAAWSIASFLTLFDSAVTSTLFPELSRADAAGSREAVSNLVEQSLQYGGLFLIPGLFGGVLLSERLLRIYGPEFARGATVLWVLILATLLYAYQKQLMNALNGIDRPDASFRINLAFIATNVALNVALIPVLGVVGAAAATALSAGLGLGLAAYVLRSEVAFSIPTREIALQFVAAGLMAGVVWSVESFLEFATSFDHNFGMVLTLVSIGGTTYFLALFYLSTAFRRTVIENSPIRPPFAPK